MATHKVIQNIEAEDKLIGPLSLKQFIYAAIAAICLYSSVFSVTKGLVWPLAVLLPPGLIAGFLAFPWGRDQSTETWLLAKIRFRVKPKIRIWSQAGLEELVTVTVPKKVDKHLTKDLTPTQVNSRLKALAETIDSRGWAVKNVDPSTIDPNNINGSDRLIEPAAAPALEKNSDDEDAEDILDDKANPNAERLERLMNNSAQTHHQEALASIQNARHLSKSPSAEPKKNYLFMDSPSLSGLPDPSLSTFGVAPPGHSTSSQTPQPAQPAAATISTAQPTINQAQAAMTEAAQSDKLRQVKNQELARNNDRTVESIARERQQEEISQGDDGEVVISLH